LLKAAKLARIKLEEQEAEQFLKEMEDILAIFSKISNLEVTEEPTFHPFIIKDILRKDAPKPSLTQEQALSNTTHKENGYFKGPRTFA